MKITRKRYNAECKRCKNMKKMEVVGISDDNKYVSLKCSSCHMVFLFPTEWFKNNKVVQPPSDLQNVPAHAQQSVVEYSFNKTFNLGQRIYHKRFNDVGEVISKKKLERGSKIVVSFKRCGEKTLVEGLSMA